MILAFGGMPICVTWDCVLHLTCGKEQEAVVKGLSFREAEEADFAAVLNLATQLANHIEEGPPPLTMENFVEFYLGPHPPMHLLLAEMEGRVVGLIAWVMTHELYSAERRVYISDVSVDRLARGLGVGTALLSEVAQWARDHRAAKMGWEVWHRNAEAKAFYEKLGASVDREAIPYGLKLVDERVGRDSDRSAQL